MENADRRITVLIRFRKRQAVAALVAALVCLLPVKLATQQARQQMSLTTYYPAPFGVYQQLQVETETYLAYISGRVGIGTQTPASSFKLEVNGGTLIQGDADVTGRAAVGQNLTAANGAVTLGNDGGFHLKASGNLVLGGQTGRVHIGTSVSQYLGRMCKVAPYYNMVLFNPCPNGGVGWVPLAFAKKVGPNKFDILSDKARRTPDRYPPLSGHMLCCKMERP
ncbi:MAG: hypothetical protein ABII00_19140 [Elusimicrobiota bacterium]